MRMRGFEDLNPRLLTPSHPHILVLDSQQPPPPFWILSSWYLLPFTCYFPGFGLWDFSPFLRLLRLFAAIGIFGFDPTEAG